MTKKDLELKRVPNPKLPSADDPLLPVPAEEKGKPNLEQPDDPTQSPPDGPPDTNRPSETEGKCGYDFAA